MVSRVERMRKHAYTNLVLAAGIGFVVPFAASAQAVAQSSVEGGNEQGASDSVPEIVVTGSLLKSNGFDAPTPVTVIGAEALDRVSATDISEAINQIPSVRSSLRPTSSTNLPSLAGGNYIDLRGLGYQRTQVLIDARRYVPTTSTGGVSISSIPQALVGGIDVITGGASATYGSDAVAGVVNLRIDDKLQGVRGEVQGGISKYGDYKNFLVSVAGGMRSSDGSLRAVVGLEWSQNSGIEYLADRPWAADSPGVINNPAYSAANPSPDQPRLLLVKGGIRSTNVAYGGVISAVRRSGAGGTGNAGLVNLQFLPDGSVVPFNNANIGGDGTQNIAYSVGAVPIDRKSAFGRLVYEASPALHLTAEAAYSAVSSTFRGIASAPPSQHVIQRDNVFIPSAIRSILDQPANLNIASFTLGRGGRDIGRTMVEVDTKTFQAVLGAGGEIGGGWEYSAYYTYGRTINTEQRPENRITRRFNAALDAVDNPATPGVVDAVCRINVDANPANDDPSCRPINLFGENRFSAESAAYVLGTSFTRSTINQHVLQGTVRGTPFATWAGDVSVAAGGEYRRLELAVTSDPISAAQGWSNGGVIPYSGHVSVKEAFAEVLVPLVLDQSWAKRLSLNLAGRITDYSTSGQVETWKAGLDYTISDALRFRATRSRDIRAPSTSELFAKGGTTQLTINDGALGSYLVTAANAGNPLLTPEKANTFTAGVVFTPSFLPRFRASVDYYDINLNDAIISLTPATIVDRCQSGASPQLCQFIVRDPNSIPAPNMIKQVNNFPANLQSVKTRGFDLEMHYRIPLANGDEISLQGLATHILHSSIDDGVTTLRLDGSVEQASVAAIGGSPKWRLHFNGNYKANWGRLSATARFIGAAKISRSYTALDMSPEDNSVSSQLYADLSGEIYLINGNSDRRVSLYGAINNVFNKFPPITGTGSFGTSRAIYDTVGRTFTVGVRFAM